MNKKYSWAVIIIIFVLPIILYKAFKSPQENISAVAIAHEEIKPKVFHFSQAMCFECKKLDAVLKPIEENYKTRITFVNIDVSSKETKNEELIKKYNVKVVPTLVFMDKSGKIYKITEGALSKEHLKGFLNKIAS